MKILFKKTFYTEVEKAFGKKDLSKLHQKVITDKNGHQRKVWVKGEDLPKEKRVAKQEELIDNNKKTPVSDNLDDLKAIQDVSINDTITFISGKDKVKGNIVAIGDDGVTVKTNGVVYQVRWKNIIKNETKKGTVEPEKFNAKDFANNIMDKSITNDEQGVDYFLKTYMHGEEGKEMSQKCKEYENAVNNRIATRGATFNNYRLSGEGIEAVYTPERQKLHKKIIDEIFSYEKMRNAMPKAGEKAQFVILGGRAGAGKSWFTDTSRNGLYDPKNYIVIDPDAIKEKLPEYEGWNAGEVHEESSDLSKIIIEKAKELGLNIILDGTMKSPKKTVKQVQEFKDAGYSISCDYMFTPMQESMKRACNRFRTRKNDYSGRFVPLNIMTEMTTNEDSFEAIKDMCDRYSFRDNYNTTNGMPTLITQKGNY